MTRHEDLRDVIAAYHRAVADVVRALDGFVANYMGDGVLIYFGYPRPRGRCRAGLGVTDAVGRLDVKSTRLQARIGTATGLASAAILSAKARHSSNRCSAMSRGALTPPL